jgi:Phage tail protein (Tail_P2_I)
MRRFNAEDLYRLLPAVYRARDAETAGQLRALVSVLAEQAGVVEDDITRLYENWFIETCDEWVVPYIGDLLGVGGLHQLPGASAFSQRARVANTLAHRRRKGTATMLEQLARDTTGWNARTVEFFELLSTTQHFNHVRLLNHRTADLRQAGKLELLNTPFDTIAHTADVRHIASTRGRHNVPNVGVHLWRLQAYAVTESDARGVGNPADRSFTFDPAGGFWPIFNRPQTESEITKLAKETNVPVPLRRRPLYEELEELRQASADGRPAAPPVYFGDTPPFRIWRQAVPNGDVQEITADKISIADLSAVGGGSILPATPEELLSHRSAFRAGGIQRPRSGSGSEAGPRHAPPRPAPTPPARQLCIWLWGRSRGRPLQSRRQRRFRARPQSKMAARCD